MTRFYERSFHEAKRHLIRLKHAKTKYNNYFLLLLLAFSATGSGTSKGLAKHAATAMLMEWILENEANHASASASASACMKLASSSQSLTPRQKLQAPNFESDLAAAGGKCSQDNEWLEMLFATGDMNLFPRWVILSTIYFKEMAADHIDLHVPFWWEGPVEVGGP